jgi:nicotinamidase-related amidase
MSVHFWTVSILLQGFTSLLLLSFPTSTLAFVPNSIRKPSLISATSVKLQMSLDHSLNPDETAIVLIEYQNEFCSPGGKMYDAVKDCLDATNMLENSRTFVQAARLAGCKIVHCPIQFEPGHAEISKSPYGVLAAIKNGQAFTAGTWGAEFYEPMKPVIPGDLIVKGKSGLCGFQSTNLDFLLSQNGIRNVVLGGFLTNCCVESTMRTAYEKGYKVYTLKDCVAATSLEGQNAVLEHNFGMFSVPTTSQAVLQALNPTTSMQSKEPLSVTA